MTATEFVGRLRRRTGALSNTCQTVYAVLFGDRLGLTVFLLLTSVEHYALGDTHLLPMMRALGELLALY